MKRILSALAVASLISCGGGGEDYPPLHTAEVAPDWSLATGKGTYIFVVDTGVRRDHRDFVDRLQAGPIFLASPTEAQVTYGDCVPNGGHGTGVASVAARIAPEATIVPLIAVNCIGWLQPEDVVRAVDWVISQTTLRPAVINLSLGGMPQEDIDAAVQRALDARISVAVAAGNDAKDACLSTPARVPDAYTAGAADQTGQIAWFSNRGPCVDYFLPGVEQMVASSIAPNGLTVGTGTSYAAPYAAGWAAKILGKFPQSSPAEVKVWLDEEYAKSGLPPAGSQ